VDGDPPARRPDPADLPVQPAELPGARPATGAVLTGLTDESGLDDGFDYETSTRPFIPHHVRLAGRKPLSRDIPRPGSMAATIAAAVKAKREELNRPPPGHCLTCATRWGRRLLQGCCVCTGHALTGKDCIPRSPT
jgi:hypothetical protein